VQSSPAPTSSISISRLRADLKGRVIAPDDAGYDEARTIFPGGIDRRRLSSSDSQTPPMSRTSSRSLARGGKSWPFVAAVTASTAFPKEA